ncbi:hypothetical protein [Sulfuriflexus mobilis]|uniref:hypothetical protein n=1 Tax=Sulfuriflexus mobilis TaxID=1811807 RepID=UPI000F834FCD|nr:hypothetical protein [Sulfuriflexus mobilis]
MPKQKSSKIFLKNGDSQKVFMWTIVGSDGSVMMGFPWETNEDLALVMDEELGDLKREDVVSQGYTGRSKISFHKSGHFKLNSRMGKTEEAIDRITIKGPSFDEITTPARLAELLLPESIPDSNYEPTERDIVIDVTNAESLPTRCTISCIRNEEFMEINFDKSRVVDTSIWEASHALENDTHTWMWTFRKSKDDTRYADKIYVTLLGSPKWGIE